MKKTALSLWMALGMMPWPGAAQAQESGMDTYDLPEVVVSGSRYHGGIIGSTTAVGNMLGEKDTMDVPMNTKAVSKDAFTVFAMPGHELEDGMTVIPTVRRSTSALSVRGFYTPASMLQINGVPGMLEDLDIKTNFLERADVVSGPAIVYNGSSTAGRAGGGHISLQSKRAGKTPLTAVDMRYVSAGNVTEGIDIGRRFGKNAAWGIRVNALNQGGTLARFGEKREARNLFINIDHYDKHSRTNLLLGYEYKRVSGKTLYFAPGKNLNALPAPPDGDANMMPEWSYFQSTTKLAILSHEQRFDAHWTAFFNAGVKSYERPVSMSNSNTSLIADGDGNFTGRFRENVTLNASKSLKYYIGGGVRVHHDFGETKNELVVGVDTAYAKNWSASSKTLATIVGNLYGQNRWAEPTYDHTPLRLSSKTVVSGLSAVDTVNLFGDKLLLNVGLHHHSYKPYTYNSGDWRQTASYNATCPTYGAVYKFTPQLVLYANHAETFDAGTVVGTRYANAGELLPPSKVKSNELGLKYQNKDMIHTLALFRSTNPSYLTTDDNYYVPLGENLYRGAEYTFAGPIAKKWDIFGGIAYTRWTWVRTSYGKQYEGMTANGIPKWNGSIGFTYKPNDALSLLGRLVYVGSAQTEFGKYRVAGYARFDFGAKYKMTIDHTPVTFTAMCYNLFNKKYWITANQGSQLLPAESRTFMLGAHVEL